MEKENIKMDNLIITFMVIAFLVWLAYIMSKFTPYNNYKDTAKDYGLYKYYYFYDGASVEWIEPREGIDKDGNKYTIKVILRANIDDTIAMARLNSNRDDLSDDELLESFLEIHWGKIK